MVISGNATSCFAMPVIAVNTKRYLNQRLRVSSLLKHEHAVGMKLFEKRSVLHLCTIQVGIIILCVLVLCT